MAPVVGGRSALRAWYAFAVVSICLLVLLATAPTSAEVPDSPIDPDNGEATLLELVDSLPINDIQNALNHFPVPYVVMVSAGGAEPTIVNQRAGSPTRVDADRSKATGQGGGGQDLIIEVNTELAPTPRLDLSIERLGAAPFASDLEVIVVFPFDAFNTEDASEAGNSPNLFFGYRTTAAFNGSAYPPGGYAPELVSFSFVPGILAGTNHTFDLLVDTTGAANPVRFIAGHFDAAPGSSNPEDAIAMGALADPVPSSIALGLTINASPILTGGTTTGSFAVDWLASAPARVMFNYIENEGFPFPVQSDYGTTLTYDLMPTSESVTIWADYATETLGLSHRSNAPIGEVLLSHRRNDGLEIEATATDVPREVDLVIDFDGAVTVMVDENTMDLFVEATQEGGFPGSDAFFGYPMEYLSAAVRDVPDMTASFDAADQTFTVAALNPGEFIGAIEFVMDDDASSRDDPLLQLPPTQDPPVGDPWDQASRHVFSLVDDGVHGTAAARVVQVVSGTLDLDAPDLSNLAEAYSLTLASPARPLTAYLMTTPDSQLTGLDIEATCNVHNFPHGTTTFTIELPPPGVSFGYTTDPPQGIDEVGCFGHVGNVNFEIFASDLPPDFSFDFDPYGSLDVMAMNGAMPDMVGSVRVRLWDFTGDGLPLGAADVLGVPLRDARARVDAVPSFGATWADGPSTAIVFNTVEDPPSAYAYLGGAQVDVATDKIGADGLPPLPAAGPSSEHRLRFVDEGDGGLKRLSAGVFGIDQFSYASSDASRSFTAAYQANQARKLTATFDSTFGGRFFPDYDINVTATVEDVPAAFSIETDFATMLETTGSAGIDAVTVTGSLSESLASGSGADVSYTDTTVLHTGQAWTANQFAGGRVFSGGIERAIVSNTADELTITPGWGGDLPAAEAAYVIASRTDVTASITGLPTNVTFSLNTDSEGGAEMTMDGPIDAVSVELASDFAIFGSDWRHIMLGVEDIPANWSADWGRIPNRHANLVTSSPLGPVSIVLSRDVVANTPSKYDPFTVAGTNVQYTTFAREIDRRYLRYGAGDDNVRETVFMSRLDGLYNDTVQLVDGDDHLIMRNNSEGDLDFLSVQLTGFQCLAAQVGPGSPQCVAKDVNAGELNLSILLPVAGEHPLYVAMESDPGEFMVGFVPDIPDSASVVVGDARAHVDFSGSPGDITLYQGPLPMANDGNEAMKVQLIDTPSFVHLDWSLGFPGGITFDSSNPLEVRLVTQDGSTRTVADFAVGDLSASWGYEFGTTTEKCQLDPPGCGEYLNIARVFFNFSATPALEGFLMSYDLIGGPSTLTPVDPDGGSPAGNEYVPRLSVLLEGFEEFEASVQLEVCLIGICPIGVILPNVDIDTDLLGSFNLDWWDLGGGWMDFFGEPDYRINDPWDFWPLSHDQSDHLFPFSP